MSNMLLDAKNITVDFGGENVLNIDRFTVYDGERIGLIGENGAGKTTLLRILAGELTPDTGRVERFGEVSFIHQMGLTPETADAAYMSLFGAQEAREHLSGGEKTRLRLAGAYSRSAHVLLADEPTTDLDADGIELLTGQLISYPGAVVLVSHDRRLLTDVCTSIAELKNGSLTLFPGSYADYVSERERQREFQQFEYDQYRSEKARLTRAIQFEREAASQKHHLPSRMGNSEARLHKREATVAEGQLHKVRKALESRLDRLEVKTRPDEDPEIKMLLGAFSPIVSNKAVEIRNLTLTVPGKTLFTCGGASLKTGTRTALTGKNGVGKTTLIRAILDGNPAVRVSPGVKPGYFGQDHEDVLNMRASVIENVMRVSAADESTARTVLAQLNLRGDEVYKPCSVLSGGERAKVCLARLLVADVNLLILDEPTNHIDLYTAEALEELLSSYRGTLLITSHDRAFTESVAQRLWIIENGRLTEFEGNLQALHEQQNNASAPQDGSIEITMLEMKLADLAARLGKPKKGDKPDELSAEYDALQQKIRFLRQK